jgi:predicted porin
MKKSLIALAALAATTAFAQSSVQIDGVLDVGVQQINYKGNTATGVNGNGSSTSQINFRGSEDLGGGLKANFRVETDWNTVSNKGNTGSASTPVTVGNETVAAASSFGNGEIRAGLAGGFGSIDAGAVNYNTLGTYLTGQPFGTAIGSGFRTFYVNDAQGTSQVRSDNSVKYVTPDLMGFKASLYYAAKQTKAVDTTTSATANAVKQTSFGGLGAYDMQGTTEMGLNYANGPLAASFSSLKQDYNLVGTGTTESTVNTFGANYALGAAKVFALYQTNKTNTSSVNNKAMSLSATYTMGAVVLMAQVGELKNDVNNTKSTLTGLGADYALSKTTALYFRAESIDDKAGSVQAAVTPTTIKGTGTTFARTAVGIRVGF